MRSRHMTAAHPTTIIFVFIVISLSLTIGIGLGNTFTLATFPDDSRKEFHELSSFRFFLTILIRLMNAYFAGSLK